MAETSSSSSGPGAEDKMRDVLGHWRLYGQRGMTPDHRVGPREWKSEPFIAPVTSPWVIKIDPDQLPLLLLGFKPSMHIPPMEHVAVNEAIKTHIFMSTSRDPSVNATEDKWFVFAEGPDCKGEVRIHMHRSWTGYKHIELVIDAGYEGYGMDGTGAKIKSIIWESDIKKGLSNPSADAYKEIAREVCNWVLNVRLTSEES